MPSGILQLDRIAGLHFPTGGCDKSHGTQTCGFGLFSDIGPSRNVGFGVLWFGDKVKFKSSILRGATSNTGSRGTLENPLYAPLGMLVPSGILQLDRIAGLHFPTRGCDKSHGTQTCGFGLFSDIGSGRKVRLGLLPQGTHQLNIRGYLKF